MIDVHSKLVATRPSTVELRQFRYFVRIVESGSISRAANTLYVAQSAISQQIAKLEDELGCQLLSRSARGVTLTQAGEHFHQTAVKVLREVDEVKATLVGSQLQPRGKVSLGLPNSISLLCTAPLIARVANELPDVVLSIHESTSSTLPELLLSGRVDFAILFEEDLVKGFNYSHLFRDPFYLVEHVTGQRGPEDINHAPATIRDIEGKRLAIAPPTNIVRRLLDSACRVYGVHYQLGVEVSAPAAILNAMRHGKLATVCPWATVLNWQQEPGLSIREIVEPNLSRTVVLATAADAMPSEAAAAVHGIVCDLMAQLGKGSGANTTPS